jgi:hypothetical protein
VNLCRFLIFVYIYIVFGEPIIKMGNAKIPLNDLTPPYFYASPKSGPGFQMPYIMVFFCVQWCEVRGSFFYDIYGIVDHCLKFLFKVYERGPTL